MATSTWFDQVKRLKSHEVDARHCAEPMAQRELLRELVERSRERVTQVRAGSSLLHVLQQQQLSSSTSLPLLPPAPALAIASKRRTRKTIDAESVYDHHQARRRRDALPRLAKDVAQLPEAATSFEQYQSFMANKIYREETMHLQSRRAALVPKADLLKKLAAVCAAALKEMESEEDAPAVRESLREKLVRAMGLLRGGRAFEQAKSLSPPPPSPLYGEIKNAHLAFLQFKRDGVGTTTQKHAQPGAGLQDGNTSTKTPIHFGDQICLLSSSFDLPLAIGSDGRSRPAEDSSAGPHMTFTIVDFRNPSRFDEVTSTDDFWLRVDPTVLAPRRFDAQHLYFDSGNVGASDPTDEDGDGDDLTSLLSDTSYYLGCPGWLDDGESTLTSPQDTTISAQTGNTQPAINGRNPGDHRPHGQKRFRIMAMKALTPSKEYYGDDAATREYAVETNDSIMRLARWRFVRYSPRKHEQVGETENGSMGLDSEQDVNDAMVNCSIVYLVLSDFTLVYDEEIKRGVGVRMSSDTRESTSEVLHLHKNGHEHEKKEHRHHRKDSSVIASAIHLSSCARWQVRILHRTGGINFLQELELAMAAVTGDVKKEDDARVEWLRKKQNKMASNNRRLHKKSSLVLNARRQYDLIAVQSNSKLEQIEREKGAQSVEYFQQRLKTLGRTESGRQPYEILQMKQQQLQRVVELPHI